MKTAAYIAALVLLALSYPVFKAYYSDVNQRDSDILLPVEARLVSTEPRIIQAKLIDENPEQIRVAVEYTIPMTAADGDYSLSVHPDMGHWRYSGTTLQKGGRHWVEMEIGFRPQQEDVISVDSTKLMFYFGHSKDRNYIGNVGEREALFPKTWRKAY